MPEKPEERLVEKLKNKIDNIGRIERLDMYAVLNRFIRHRCNENRYLLNWHERGKPKPLNEDDKIEFMLKRRLTPDDVIENNTVIAEYAMWRNKLFLVLELKKAIFRASPVKERISNKRNVFNGLLFFLEHREHIELLSLSPKIIKINDSFFNITEKDLL